MKTIPPSKLVPVPLSEDARCLPGFGWAGEEAGTRHLLGGEPPKRFPRQCWPRCSDCGEKMSFYGQFDSINQEYCVADVSVICVWLCFGCNEVIATIEQV